MSEKRWCQICMKFIENGCSQHKVTRIQDKEPLPLAISSLPPILRLKCVKKEGSTHLKSEDYSVYAKKQIVKNTEFGPLLCQKSTEKPSYSNTFPLIILKPEQDHLYCYYDDLSICNWMALVKTADCRKSQNLMAYMDGRDHSIYFITIKDIPRNAELLVWYGEEYSQSIGNIIKIPRLVEDLQIESIPVLSKRKVKVSQRKKKIYKSDNDDEDQEEEEEEEGNYDDDDDDLNKDVEYEPNKKQKKKSGYKINLPSRNNKESVRKTGLYDERKTHTNQITSPPKTLPCNQCGLVFSEASVFNLHTLVHAAVTAGFEDDLDASNCHEMSNIQNITTSSEEQPHTHDNDSNRTTSISESSKSDTEKEGLIERNDSGCDARVASQCVDKVDDIVCPMCERVFESRMLLIHHTKEHALDTHISPPSHQLLYPHQSKPSQLKQQKCLQEKVDSTSELESLANKQDTSRNVSSHLYKNQIQLRNACNKRHRAHHHATKKKYMVRSEEVKSGKGGVVDVCEADKRGCTLPDANHPFYCKVCQKQFSTSSAYSVHQKTHSSKSFYNCTLCEQSFKLHSQLQAHGKSMHVRRSGVLGGELGGVGKALVGVVGALNADENEFSGLKSLGEGLLVSHGMNVGTNDRTEANKNSDEKTDGDGGRKKGVAIEDAGVDTKSSFDENEMNNTNRYFNTIIDNNYKMSDSVSTIATTETTTTSISNNISTKTSANTTSTMSNALISTSICLKRNLDDVNNNSVINDLYNDKNEINVEINYEDSCKDMFRSNNTLVYSVKPNYETGVFGCYGESITGDVLVGWDGSGGDRVMVANEEVFGDRHVVSNEVIIENEEIFDGGEIKTNGGVISNAIRKGQDVVMDVMNRLGGQKKVIEVDKSVGVAKINRNEAMCIINDQILMEEESKSRPGDECCDGKGEDNHTEINEDESRKDNDAINELKNDCRNENKLVEINNTSKSRKSFTNEEKEGELKDKENGVELVEGTDKKAEKGEKGMEIKSEMCEEFYDCPECHRSFDSFEGIRRHMRRLHSGRSYPCPVCNKQLPLSDKLKLHLLTHSSFREFVCEKCGKQFKRKDKLHDHVKRLHTGKKKKRKKGKNGVVDDTGDDKAENEDDDDDDDDSSLPSKVKFIPQISPNDYQKFTYKCYTCLVGFKRRGMLVNHVLKKHPEQPIDSIQELSQPIIKYQHEFFCIYCDKVFKSNNKRKQHILKAHPGFEPPSSLRQARNLENASDKTTKANFSSMTGHVTVDPFTCHLCKSQFSTKSKFIQHLKQKHQVLPSSLDFPTQSQFTPLHNINKTTRLPNDRTQQLTWRSGQQHKSSLIDQQAPHEYTPNILDSRADQIIPKATTLPLLSTTTTILTTHTSLNTSQHLNHNSLFQSNQLLLDPFLSNSLYITTPSYNIPIVNETFQTSLCQDNTFSNNEIHFKNNKILSNNTRNTKNNNLNNKILILPTDKQADVVKFLTHNMPKNNTLLQQCLLPQRQPSQVMFLSDQPSLSNTMQIVHNQKESNINQIVNKVL